MSHIYEYKGTKVRLLEVEPDRVLLQACDNYAVAWADWSDFHELAEPCDVEANPWRVELFDFMDYEAWVVARDVPGTGDKYRRPNLELFDGGRLYTYRAEAEETAEWLNKETSHV